MKLYTPEAYAERRLGIVLALIAGYLDGYGLLFLGTYVSFMSGNTTVTGLRGGQANFHAALPAAVAVLFFTFGSFIGNSVTHQKTRYPHRVLFGCITALFAVTAFAIPHHASTVIAEVASLSLAMGMLNPALSKIGKETISLTFMTGTLSRIGGHLASACMGEAVPDAQGPGDTHLNRARIDASVWLGFLCGAGLFGLAYAKLRGWTLVPPGLIMLFLTFFSNSDTLKPSQKLNTNAVPAQASHS